jgi:hypothetical protein
MKRFIALTAVLVMGLAQAAMAGPIVLNGGFETPAMAEVYITQGYGIWPVASSGSGGSDVQGDWTFSAAGGENAGFVHSGTILGTSTIDAQTGYVQGTGSISQSVDGFVAGQSYVVDYLCEARNDGGNPNIVTTIDGTTIDILTPATGGLTHYVSDPFTVSTSGAHTLAFTGTISAATRDNLAVFDSISIRAVPEPSTALLFVTGVFGLLAYAWRKRK